MSRDKALHADLQMYRQMYQQIYNENERVYNENEQLKKRNDQLERQAIENEQQNSAQIEAFKQQAFEVDRLRNTLGQNEHQLHFLTTENNNAHRNNFEKNREITELRKRISVLERSLKTAEDNKKFVASTVLKLEEDLKKEKSSSARKAEKLTQEKEKLITDHKQEVKQLEALNNNIKMQLRDVDQNSINLHNQEVDQMNSYIQTLKERIGGLEADKRSLQSTLSTFATTFRDVKKDLEIQKLEVSRLTRELETLREGNRHDLADRNCLICLCEMEETGQDFKNLPKCKKCFRSFHSQCLSDWFRQNPSCPVCRRNANQMENADEILRQLFNELI